MIIGTAGHIDHGKTALVRALTGVDADRLAEEKARGITIELGFAYADLGLPDDPQSPSGRITGFVDVPGHERLIRTMLAGAGGIDFALLVVAADDGVMPQTREHLEILNLLGLSGGVVAMTRADLAGPERRAEVAAGIRTALAGTRLAGARIIEVSALTGEGIDTLRQVLARAGAEMPARAARGPMRLSVDRSFTIAGAGTVVTGTMIAGRVAVGDQVMISPLGLPARVRGIHAQNRKAEEGLAGQRCALNLAGDDVTKDAIRRGDMILAPGLHAPSDRIDVMLKVVASEQKPVTTWLPVHLYSHATEVAARVVPIAGDIAPGKTGLAQLVLERPIAATMGERFVLRDTSATRSIAGGFFIDPRAPARKRGTPERLAWLDAARATEPAPALTRLLQVAPVDLPVFLRDRGLDPASGPELTAETGAVRFGDLALSPDQVQGLRQDLTARLAAFHEANPDLAGLGRERLRLSLTPRLPKEVFLLFLQEEAGAGRLALDGAFLRLPGHQVRLSPEDEALFAQIFPRLQGEERFRPPRVRDFSTEFGVEEKDLRRLMRHSQRLGLTDQIANDHFFARVVVREMVAILRDVAAASADGWITAPAFRDRMQNGRKVAIEILDFFDRHGLTLRRGDLRRLNPHRIDLFD
ncbi:selenocysteine-specific translation elongation factor [Pseudogemmobacter bohemicus]|uniref:selenocysteine-specific translation elongation factor n=1 Tax=Pseudogemmobacter bohemicus TaxID=2250708 RepID=UPI000DD3C775|nr:selenocysteine-specific translation elongation factor [Pseudogemmobacter bohemicus]